MINKQSLLSFVEFSQKDERLRFILKLQIVFEKLIFKLEKVKICVRKSKYVIFFELNVFFLVIEKNLIIFFIPSI